MRAFGAANNIKVSPIGFQQWETLDPFMFCAYHKDAYPAAQPDGTIPKHMLIGRDIGSDFMVKDGFRMYHGENGVPGFPQHPHYGFETVTVVREGVCDHHDSLGATARFGGGGSDTQWVTTGRDRLTVFEGMSHSEMFSLPNTDKPNPLELFQLWLNLPSKTKRANPYFTMFWSHQNVVIKSELSTVTVIADEGKAFAETKTKPPPESWASEEGSGVAIVFVELAPKGEFKLPISDKAVNRKLFFYSGDEISVGDLKVKAMNSIHVAANEEHVLKNTGNLEARILLLQGKPIGEPVVQRGPFVTNSQQEMQQVFMSYQRTQFGGWPWPSSDPSHSKSQKRFAMYPDGRVEYPEDLKADREL